MDKKDSDISLDEHPKRKKTRLENFDYSTPGVYSITICTSERRNYFWINSRDAVFRPQDVKLSAYGKIVDEAINNIHKIYPSVTVEQYVIMPDHIHLLLMIHAVTEAAPTISRLSQQLKGYITKRIGFSIWQKLFNDHVIRNIQDYEEHKKYIYENPMRWYYKQLKIGNSDN